MRAPKPTATPDPATEMGNQRREDPIASEPGAETCAGHADADEYPVSRALRLLDRIDEHTQRILALNDTLDAAVKLFGGLTDADDLSGKTARTAMLVRGMLGGMPASISGIAASIDEIAQEFGGDASATLQEVLAALQDVMALLERLCLAAEARAGHA